jgi:hypothetical protein
VLQTAGHNQPTHNNVALLAYCRTNRTFNKDLNNHVSEHSDGHDIPTCSHSKYINIDCKHFGSYYLFAITRQQLFETTIKSIINNIKCVLIKCTKCRTDLWTTASRTMLTKRKPYDNQHSYLIHPVYMKISTI